MKTNEATLLTTRRRALLFFLSSAALLIAFLLAGQRGEAWQTYQRAYLAAAGQGGPPTLRQVTPHLDRNGQPTDHAEPELCLACHLGLAEISPSHPVETFGCVLCHDGNGLALDAGQAHEGLIANPSDLRVAGEKCGQKGCHGGYTDPSRNHVARVTHSLQATYAGAIAQVRYTFGIQHTLQPLFGVIEATDTAPLSGTVSSLAAYSVDRQTAPVAEQEFAQNCLQGGCHLTADPADIPYRYRATGCAACHVLYNDDGLYRGADPTLSRSEPGHAAAHRFTTAIPFGQCNHCHNRGNYSLRTMKFTPRPDLPPAGPPISAQMPDEGRRRLAYYQPISQFTRCEWELDCIDCHTQGEAMGDGHLWPDEKQMEYVRCQTCHGTLDELPATVRITDTNDLAIRQAQRNGHYTVQVGDVVLLTARGEKLGNVQLRNGRLLQFAKVTGQQFEVPLVKGSACQQRSDQQEAKFCHRCHSVQR